MAGETYFLFNDCRYFLQLSHSLQVFFIKIGVMVALCPFLRKFGFWKLFLVSFCVTKITVYIPIIEKYSFIVDQKVTLIQRFLIVISLVIPFEIVDSETEDKTLKTLPQLFGISITKLFGVILFFLSFRSVF